MWPALQVGNHVLRSTNLNRDSPLKDNMAPGKFNLTRSTALILHLIMLALQTQWRFFHYLDFIVFINKVPQKISALATTITGDVGTS